MIISKSFNCRLEGDEDEDEEDEEDEGEDEEEPGLDYLQKENLEVNVCYHLMTSNNLQCEA